MNKVILIGNLTRDPELRTTNSGINVCTFSIAVNRRMANAQGVREADFFNIVAWRQLADLCSRYLAKGRKVCVVGQLQNRSYDAQDGSKRTVTEIVADDIEFLPSANGTGAGYRSEEAPMPQEPAAPRASAASFAPTQMNEADDDDLPF